MPWSIRVSLVFLLSFGAPALAQQKTEPIAIFEVGDAPGWSVTGAGSTNSPTVAVEATPIENWLELELGTTPSFSHHVTTWDTDLLFKKPWTVSKKLEIMAGIGPTWIHARDHGISVNSVGVEVALDFMYWPYRSRRFGWYFEPAYEYDFTKGRDQSVGFSAGLLIAVWK